MPAPTIRSTKALGQAIANYGAALVIPNTSTAVYRVAQLELINDVLSQINDGGAVLEVYGNLDGEERHGFGGAGRMRAVQTWYLLSMCSLETPALASYIYDVSDYLMVPFETHVVLGNPTTGIYQAQLKPNSGRFYRVQRNGVWLKAHLCEIETRHRVAGRSDSATPGWCVGGFQWKGDSGPVWTLESMEPLTLSPSIRCGCGHHGWIKSGKWIGA